MKNSVSEFLLSAIVGHVNKELLIPLYVSFMNNEDGFCNDFWSNDTG